MPDREPADRTAGGRQPDLFDERGRADAEARKPLLRELGRCARPRPDLAPAVAGVLRDMESPKARRLAGRIEEELPR